MGNMNGRNRSIYKPKYNHTTRHSNLNHPTSFISGKHAIDANIAGDYIGTGNYYYGAHRSYVGHDQRYTNHDYDVNGNMRYNVDIERNIDYNTNDNINSIRHNRFDPIHGNNHGHVNNINHNNNGYGFNRL